MRERVQVRVQVQVQVVVRAMAAVGVSIECRSVAAMPQQCPCEGLQSTSRGPLV